MAVVLSVDKSKAFQPPDKIYGLYTLIANRLVLKDIEKHKLYASACKVELIRKCLIVSSPAQ